MSADGPARRADRLDDAALATAQLVARLAGAWADATGRRWAGRLHAIGLELSSLADDARGCARDAAAPDADRDTDPDADRDADRDAEACADGACGVRLGGQSGTRATGRRGVVLPTLPGP